MVKNNGTKIIVKIKEDEFKFSESFFEYDAFAVSNDDALLNDLVNQTMSKYKGDLKSPDISIRIDYQWSA